MALRSKNFLFRRIGKDGEEMDYQDTDSWYNTNNDYHWNEVSLPLAAGGYYGSTSGLHTIAFTLRNFIGRIYVEATLASNPTEADWFPIKFEESCKFYIEFTDTVIYNPDSEKTIYQHGVTGTFAENVIGNFTYLRVGVRRDYISVEPTELQKTLAGKLEEIQINY
ncbi:structural protein [Pectobacterium phage vB_PcaM_CBB]|uniref:Structural protein n=1 Tax=Pectobacterium phage vB_PcaM_CBB TaxID=2772511 RepID=A0A1L2CUV3_9CAUD|nr:structural protein [Pectobacterium phage vB_PcaM_CBB]AMM43794.1 structural protein [Pectobacterium phage vB_PcaM_CBB]